MEANHLLLNAYQCKKNALDRAYKKHINKILETLDTEHESRWETYSIVMQELINEGKSDYFNEIKYRLTDGEEPNSVMLDILNRELDNTNGLIWYFKRRIEEYLEEDNLKRFCD